jgi:hypothetical protein
VLFLAQALIYFAAIGGIVASTFGFIMHFAGAMNRARPAELRRRRALWAALCFGGIVASAATGFLAIPALLYFAHQ